MGGILLFQWAKRIYKIKLDVYDSKMALIVDVPFKFTILLLLDMYKWQVNREKQIFEKMNQNVF